MSVGASLSAAAARYAAHGFSVLPLQPRAKLPLVRLVPHGVRDASSEACAVRTWWACAATANIGIVPGSAGYAVLDIDSPQAAERGARDFGLVIGRHPCTVLTGKGWHLYFRYDGEPLPQRPLAPGIDVRHRRGYVLAPPSVHPSGAFYRWSPGAKLSQAPYLPRHVVTELLAPPPLPSSIWTPPTDAIATSELEAALQHLDADDYHVWVMVGLALKASQLPNAWSVWNEWSKSSPKYHPSVQAYRWRKMQPRSITPRSIFFHALKAGWTPSAPSRREAA